MYFIITDTPYNRRDRDAIHAWARDIFVKLNAALYNGLEAVKSPRMDIKEPCMECARLFFGSFDQRINRGGISLR